MSIVQASNSVTESPAIKPILLTAMVLQNSATVLVGRYTRSSVSPGDLYMVSHLIVTTEVCKLFLSALLEHFTTNGKLFQSIKLNILDQPKDALKIMIPALLYLIQNSLLYNALSHLTAPMFQVTCQAKLVTTAMISVVMLNRKYTIQQWVCLIVLSIGVAIVVLGESSSSSSMSTNQQNLASMTGPHSLTIGLISVAIACLSSALAGVYFEKVIKTAASSNNDNQKKPVSVWMRNIQLAFFTILTALAPKAGGWQRLLQKQQQQQSSSIFPTINNQSYFHGFTRWVWLLVALQAGGGILVAAVIKYADNVLKGLATGISVCCATACSNILFGTTLSSQFAIGAFMILSSVYLFSNPIIFRGDKQLSTKQQQF